jgi:hypothetical protein
MAEQLESAGQTKAILIERETLILADSVFSLIVARYGRGLPGEVRREADQLLGVLRGLTR